MNNPNKTSLLNAVLRQDLYSFIEKTFNTVSPGDSFVPNFHIEAIAYHLERCMTGDIRRLIITLPPRSLKSICGSVSFPAYLLGRDPTAKIICASYSNDLSAKHARDCRAVMNAPWYRELFPSSGLDPKKSAENDFQTLHGGGRIATSLGGTLTGRGGNFLIIDDPLKPQDAMSGPMRAFCNQWHDNTLISRLNDKSRDVIILIMQRLHGDDLVAHVMETDDWVHLDLPAIAEEDHFVQIGPDKFHRRKKGDVLDPTREPREVLDQMARAMGSYNFAAQYQQRPIPVAGNIVRREWFREYEELPECDDYPRIIQSWDIASTDTIRSDYSACTTWSIISNKAYLVDVRRDRLKYPDLKRLIADHAANYRATTVLIEDAGAGKHLIQEFYRGYDEYVPPIIDIAPEGDKLTRMHAASGSIEAGQVFIPKDAPWLAEFLQEILGFPAGKHDDQVDSVSQFINWKNRHYDFVLEFI